ncbi:MAG: response regulator [Pseudomonadota bacterium]
MNVASSRPAEILLVEDNENDVLLTREGFKQAKCAVNMHHVSNGIDCLAFLRKEDNYVSAPTPDLIFLDLNMPVMDGREVLSEMVEDPHLNHLPVVVLTTSDHERDVLEMYKLRCSSYVTKPVDFKKFQQVIQEISNFWFTVVVLPPRLG